jgi:hypothetical protein
MPVCTKCNTNKDASKFHKDKKKVSGLTSWCKECRNTARAGHYWKDPEAGRNRTKEYRSSLTKEQRYLQNRNTKLKQAYGISHADYVEMLEKQNYKCACCGITNKYAGVKGLVVDHNHTTGEIRELLCSQCNTALGLLKENEEVVSNMLEYIRKHNG